MPHENGELSTGAPLLCYAL